MFDLMKAAMAMLSWTGFLLTRPSGVSKPIWYFALNSDGVSNRLFVNFGSIRGNWGVREHE